MVKRSARQGESVLTLGGITGRVDCPDEQYVLVEEERRLAEETEQSSSYCHTGGPQ